MHATAPPAAGLKPARLDLDDRLALTLLAMDERINVASVAFEVNTAHIEPEPVPIVDFFPTTPALVPTLAPALSSIAAVLRRAHIRLQRDDWCTGVQKNAQGAMCLVGAIRAEVETFLQAGEAASILLDTIRRQFPDAAAVPAWNDEQRDPRTVLRMLDQAARDAEQQDI